MASDSKSRLARAMKERPPAKKPSELDRPEVVGMLESYLKGKAAGEDYGSLPWLHETILVPDFKVRTSVGNLRSYLRERFPDLYAQAMRGGKV